MKCHFSSNFCQTGSKLMADTATSTLRSTEPSVYQHLEQPIGAMAKSFADGSHIPLHHHDRDQLLYAIRGVMRLRTEHEAWVVPPDRAIYIPAGTSHSVGMHGTVDMRTLYIATGSPDSHAQSMRVLVVSDLLRELVLALSGEPIDYETDSRGDRIARLIELELRRARELALSVPLPRDPRLQRLCAAILANPADRRTLDRWSEVAGASPRTLARLFERDLGMNFNKWRQRLRFHNALEALSSGEPISCVAHQNGYHSASAFSAAFSKEMGVAPSKVSSES
jgi:AraC-like DNA-binding protein/quercetin dioxygenase-like cupin family protein